MLTKEQRRAVAKAVARRKAFIWWKPGEGKTRVALAYFAAIAKSSQERHGDFLVVCRRIAFGDWKEEAEKIALKWPIVETETGILLPPSGWRVVLVSHGMLHKIQSRPWKAIAYDEGFLFKNPKSLRTKAASQTTRYADYGAIILSGSVMTAKDPTDIYGQAIAIGLGNLIARTLTDFRSRYMNKIGFGNYYTYTPRKGAYKEISKKICKYADLFFPSGRPEKHIVKHVDLQRLQKQLIANLKNDYYLEYENKSLDIKNALSLAVKCQQISNGWIKMEEGISEMPSGKVEYCLSLVEELLATGERVVIWCAFRYDVELLQRRLSVKTATLLGGAKNKFDLDKDVSVVLATEASGSSINALKDYRYAIYFSTDYSWLNLEQSRHRTNRKSSAHKGAVYYYLLSKDSLDEAVYNTAIKSGGKETELLNYVNQWVKTPFGHSDQ